MTCVVGLVKDGITYIGGDSLASNNFSKTVRKDSKVFKLCDTDKAVVGFTSSFRMGQLLMYAEGLIDNRDEPHIDHAHMVCDFVPRLMNLFSDGRYSTNVSGEESGGNFLIGYNDKLFHIYDDFQVAESVDNYDACGSGEYHASGSLYSTEGLNMSPEERIHKALQSASKFCVGVAPPYRIINTSNSEVIIFED